MNPPSSKSPTYKALPRKNVSKLPGLSPWIFKLCKSIVENHFRIILPAINPVELAEVAGLIDPEVEVAANFGFFGSNPELGAAAPPSRLAELLAPGKQKKNIFVSWYLEQQKKMFYHEL